MYRKKSPLIVALGLSLFATTFATSSFAGPINLLHKLTAADGRANDLFGSSVAIDGDTVVVGSVRNDSVATNAGAVYVFNAVTGSQTHKLTANDAMASDVFGASVAIDDDMLVVGATGDDDAGTSSGAVYLFDLQSGNQLQKLTGSNTSAFDQFGVSVDIDGDKLVVGARGNDELATDAGAAYIFDVNSGAELHKLTASNGGIADQFGDSVAIDGDTVAVGATQADSDVLRSGAVYLFDVATGDEQSIILASDRDSNDLFGDTIDLVDDTLVVGAQFDDGNGVNSGAAFLIDTSPAGGEIAKLLPDDIETNDFFGLSVAATEQYTLVSSLLGDTGSEDTGSVYLFDTVTGAELDKIDLGGLFNLDPVDHFGISLDISGNRFVISAWLDDDQGSNAGAAYVFEIENTAVGVPVPPSLPLMIVGLLLLSSRGLRSK